MCRNRGGGGGEVKTPKYNRVLCGRTHDTRLTNPPLFSSSCPNPPYAPFLPPPYLSTHHLTVDLGKLLAVIEEAVPTEEAAQVAVLTVTRTVVARLQSHNLALR